MYGSKTEEDTERLGNVRELANLATKYEHRAAGGLSALKKRRFKASKTNRHERQKRNLTYDSAHRRTGIRRGFVVGLGKACFLQYVTR